MAVTETSTLNVTSENWRNYTNCDGIAEPEVFPPNTGESLEEAKIVCRGCVSALECLAYSRSSGVETGITKVMSEQEIAELVEARRLIDELASESVS